MKVAVLIPAYNEAARIKHTLKAVKKIPEVSSIRVVNDGSTDDTSRLAKEEGVEVIDLPRNMGKGQALNLGVQGLDADVFLLLDADLGDTAVEGKHLLQPVLEGQADLAIAVFPPAQKAGFGWVKGLARWGIAKEGFYAKEPLSGQRAMTKEVLRDVLPFASGFGIEVGMTIRALRKGYRLLEVPVNMSHAATARDLKGFWHRGRQFVDVLNVIVKEGRS